MKDFLKYFEILYHDLFFDHIFMDIERQSDSIHGNPRGDGFPWSCSDIFYLHNVSHKKKSIANQWLSILAIFVSSYNRKERCVTRQNSCMGDQFPTSSAVYCDSHERCLPTKELEKSCVTKQRNAAQKCMNKTNMPTKLYKILILLLEFSIDNLKRRKKQKENNQKKYFHTLRFTVYICRMLF